MPEKTAPYGLNAGSLSSSPWNITSFNGGLFFYATHYDNGAEPWFFDGTSAALVMDINKVANTAPFAPATTKSSAPVEDDVWNSVVYQGSIYFAADDGLHGMELWRWDGDNDPEMVADIQTGAGGSEPYHFCVYANRLFFRAYQNLPGAEVAHELFMYDENNVTLVADICPGLFNSFPGEMTVYRGMYFRADNPNGGRELWRVDASIPEPTTLGLFGLAAVMLGYARRKRRT